MKIWQNKTRLLLLLAVAVLVSLVAVWKIFEPEKCPICEELRCHAPCLINLHTGEIGEMELYEPHPFKVGELAEVQRGGYFSFVTVAGLRGTKTTEPWVIDIDIPAEGEPARKSLYCKECREKLKNTTNAGYAVLDLYDRTAPVFFPIQDGMEYTLRCYEISICLSEHENLYHLTMQGNLY